ncbi:MAG: TolB-like 6-bladed beta-propeller domain-containing protein, partial [Muribaculaceae bacterium]|nr:TolB-like 6-bladed beta-propeller domain-containing protein [Muribaculaceae bacterium]
MIFLLSACSGGKENLPVVISYDKWAEPVHTYEKVEDAFNESVDSVIISGGTRLLANQDLLFIEDYKSTEKMIHVVSIPEKQYIGSFGNFGEGPSEILRPGSIFTLGAERLAVFDYGHWCVRAFDVDSALTCSDYIPQTLVSLSQNNGSFGFPDRFVYVHDDRGIARMIMPKENSGYSQALCSFNIMNGATEPFGRQNNPDGFRSSVAASYLDSVVVEVSSTQDVIRIYNLEGKLNRIIHGPLYDEKPSKELAFYSKAVIGNGRIYAIYSG